jgi:hypothetical protein
MNRNDGFDQMLQAWLHRQAPPQAPDRVLDAALERVASESQRRSWLERFFGGTTMTLMIRTAAVAAVVAVAALIGLQVSNLNNNVGNSPSPIQSPTAEPSPSSTPSPSPSLEPSAEPSATALVFRLLGGGEGGRIHLVTVLDDGLVITSDPTGATPPEKRRLTAAGVLLVRDELDGTGLTDTSGDYQPVPNPGVEPPPYGGAGPSLEVGQPGGETVVITWFLFGDTEQDYFQPQPEAEALEALAARLSTLDEWLPASAWADANATLYEPASYRMVINAQAWGGSPDDLPVERDTVSWPLDVEMANFGEVVNPAPDEIRCGFVDAAEGASVIDALEAAGATPTEGTYLSFQLGDRATGRVVTINLEPILPFAETTC